MRKIAHVGNTSGIASIIAKEQTRRGHEVEVFVFNEWQYRQFGGTFINYSINGPNGLNLHFLSERRRLFDSLKDFDIWHYHYPYGSLRDNLRKHLRDHVLLNHYHGDDIRNKIDPEFCVVSTPDLLKFAPKGIYVPTPIDIDLISKIPVPASHGQKIKVAHYPFYKNYSGYADYYSMALANLEQKGKCQVETIFGLDYLTTLSRLAECDIIIGKILPEVGWFGKFELEGMALRKPVITYVVPDLYENFHPPIWRTTKDTFEQDLELLIDNVDQQIRLGIAGEDYVKANHSIGKVCDLIEKCYERSRTSSS